MEKHSNTILKIIVLPALSTFLSVATEVVHGKGENCNFLNSSPGVCITLQDCPPLSAIWNEVTAETRLFKSLICGEDAPHETLVCCPKSEATEDQEYSNDVTKVSKFSDIPQKYPQNLPIPNRISKEHPKFSLLPSLRECGKINFMTRNRIIGGHNAQRGSHPWIVRIGVKDLENDDVDFHCAGTIINSRYILTASHCLSHLEYNQKISTIRVGEHNTNTAVDCEDKEDTGLPCSIYRDYDIAEIILHANYKGVESAEDIALIRVDREIGFTSSFVAPVCLPFWENYGLAEKYNPWSISQFDNQKGMVSGWGVWDGSRWSETEILQEICVPIVANNECQKRFDESQLKENVTISVLQMCVGGILGKACKGDSGGPVTFDAPYLMDGKRVANVFQLGIISFGLRNCTEGQVPTVFTRLTAFLEWILDNIHP